MDRHLRQGGLLVTEELTVHIIDHTDWFRAHTNSEPRDEDIIRLAFRVHQGREDTLVILLTAHELEDMILTRQSTLLLPSGIHQLEAHLPCHRIRGHWPARLAKEPLETSQIENEFLAKLEELEGSDRAGTEVAHKAKSVREFGKADAGDIVPELPRGVVPAGTVQVVESQDEWETLLRSPAAAAIAVLGGYSDDKRWILIGPREPAFACSSVRVETTDLGYELILGRPRQRQDASPGGCVLTLPRDGLAVTVVDGSREKEQ